MSIIDRLFGTDDEDFRPTFVCTGCGKAFDGERKPCPDCGSEQVVSPRSR
jgi:rRNA maturation endonuclease Nob1